MNVATARGAADIFTPLFADAQAEKLVVAHLNGARETIAVREIAGSFEAEIELPVRQILEDALMLRSRSMVLAHNHPSGNPRPSAADIQATRALAAAARALGISLDDHLIFAGGECRSFRALGLL